MVTLGTSGSSPRYRRMSEGAAMDLTAAFEAERPRLLGIATRILADQGEAEDVVQQAWLRMHGTDTAIESLPASSLS